MDELKQIFSILCRYHNTGDLERPVHVSFKGKTIEVSAERLVQNLNLFYKDINFREIPIDDGEIQLEEFA